MHTDAKVFPIGKQLDLFCQQYLANVLTLGHVSYNILFRPPGQHKIETYAPLTLHPFCPNIPA